MAFLVLQRNSVGRALRDRYYPCSTIACHGVPSPRQRVELRCSTSSPKRPTIVIQNRPVNWGCNVVLMTWLVQDFLARSGSQETISVHLRVSGPSSSDVFTAAQKWMPTDHTD